MQLSTDLSNGIKDVCEHGTGSPRLRRRVCPIEDVGEDGTGSPRSRRRVCPDVTVASTHRAQPVTEPGDRIPPFEGGKDPLGDTHMGGSPPMGLHYYKYI